MTPSQSLRTLGWIASLSQRGVLLTGEAGSFNGIVAHAPDTMDSFEVSDAQRTDAVIHVLRRDLPEGITEGSTITAPNTDGTPKTWQTVRIEDVPANILVLIHCIAIEP